MGRRSRLHACKRCANACMIGLNESILLTTASSCAFCRALSNAFSVRAWSSRRLTQISFRWADTKQEQSPMTAFMNAMSVFMSPACWVPTCPFHVCVHVLVHSHVASISLSACMSIRVQPYPFPCSCCVTCAAFAHASDVGHHMSKGLAGWLTRRVV